MVNRHAVCSPDLIALRSKNREMRWNGRPNVLCCENDERTFRLLDASTPLLGRVSYLAPIRSINELVQEEAQHCTVLKVIPHCRTAKSKCLSITAAEDQTQTVVESRFTPAATQHPNNIQFTERSRQTQCRYGQLSRLKNSLDYETQSRSVTCGGR